MDRPIVHSFEPITLVGGGQVSSEDIDVALSLAPRVVAADAGLDRALARGVMPEAVIGDMDSVSDAGRDLLKVESQVRIEEQDSTDFDKALRHISAPVVLALGFSGGRLDHQLAALHTLAFRCEQPCILIGDEEISLLAPRRISLPTRAGDVVSMVPLAPVTGQSTGLEWAIDGIQFDPLSKIGTSNRAQGEVELAIAAPCMILMLPRALTPQVVQALLLPTAARWPARE